MLDTPTEPTVDLSQRCRTGRRCSGAEILYTDEGVRIGKYGALLGEGAGLCRSCSNHISYALGSLAGDVSELGHLLQPSSAPRYSDPDLPRASSKPASKLPLRADVLDLRNLIDFEVTLWASHTNPGWDVKTARRWPLYARVRAGADILHRNASQFLALEPRLTRARSLGVNRDQGHDPDTTTRLTTDIWARRDGITAGLTLLDLHERALRYANRHEGDPIPTPCEACHTPNALIRPEGNQGLVCSVCWETFADDEYETYLDQALAAHGLAEHSYLNGPRYDGTTPWPLLDRLGRRIVATHSKKTPVDDDERDLKITPQYRGRLFDDLITDIPFRLERDRAWAALLAEAYAEHHEREKATRRAERAAERAAAREAAQLAALAAEGVPA